MFEPNPQAPVEVHVIKIDEPKTRQLAERMRSAFACLELALEPHQTEFGMPDYYTCPGCGSRMNVRGSAYRRRQIDDPEMSHAANCVLLELKSLSDAI